MSASVPALIRVEDLTLSYDDSEALRSVSLNIPSGRRVAIIGPNGAGKSTLMKAIMGLVQPQRGRVFVEGGPQALSYLPQHDDVNWDFPVTVEDVVVMGLAREIGWLRGAGRAHRERAQAALERVGMLEMAGRQISDLSGGQRRRVFIARALAQQVRGLLLDEPFAGVDAAAEASLMDVLERLHREEGLTIVLSTHDLGMAFQRFDYIIALHSTLIATGTPREVYTPEVLRQLYGKALAALHEGEQTLYFVDEHGCC